MKRDAIVALVAASVCGGATLAASLGIQPQPSDFPDTETRVAAVIAPAVTDRTMSFSIDVAAENTVTNWMEICFHSETNPLPENLAFAFGFADGRWFAREGAAAPLRSLGDVVPEGEFKLAAELNVRVDGRVANACALSCRDGATARLTGLETSLGKVLPKRWRSAVVISRRMSVAFPTLTLESEACGLSVRIR